MKKADAADNLTMPDPKPGKVPMKANAYWSARQANSKLLPLFPYDGPGDIVPCCSATRAGGALGDQGYFLHTNSVDELMLSFGSNGRVRAGDVFVGPRVHGVGGTSDTEYFALTTVTQRQLEQGPQPEAIAFPCEVCKHELFKHEFTGAGDGGARGWFPKLPTIDGSAHAARTFNATEELRTCRACGRVNAPFPLHMWGWDRYVDRTEVAEAARNALEEVIRK